MSKKIIYILLNLFLGRKLFQRLKNKNILKPLLIVGTSIVIATTLALTYSVEPVSPQVHPNCSRFFDRWQALRSECGKDCMKNCRRGGDIWGGEGIRNPLCEAACNTERGFACTLATEWDFRYRGCEDLNNAFDQATEKLIQMRDKPRQIAEREIQQVCNKNRSTYQNHCTGNSADSELDHSCQQYKDFCINKGYREALDQIATVIHSSSYRTTQSDPSLPDSYLQAPVLDPDFYLLTYGDLRKVYGQTNPDGARQHWTLHGLKEGRRSSPAFDVRYYRNIHSDLTRIFGDDFYGVVDHWLRHGITEGRRSSLVFDVKHYLGKYPDLQQAFGATNYSAAVDHWLRHGVQEGRQGSPDFDPKFYLSNNPDVARVYGANNCMGAIAHYLEFGRQEGRRGTP